MYTAMFKVGEGVEQEGFSVVVDHSVRIEDLLGERSCDGISAEINSKNFPVNVKRGKELIKVHLIPFRKRPVFGDLSLCDLFTVIKKDGYDPVDLRELLTTLNRCKVARPMPAILALGQAVDFGDDLMSVWVKEYPHDRRRAGFIKV